MFLIFIILYDVEGLNRFLISNCVIELCLVFFLGELGLYVFIILIM